MSMVQKPEITVVMVVYNKNIKDNPALSIIREYADIIVVDNSMKDFQNLEVCQSAGITYISMGGNKGLSKAYNMAIEKVDKAEAIVLLDDDTDVPENYFRILQKEMIEFPDVDIFVPIIRGQDGIIYSPNNYKFIKNDLVSNPLKEVVQSRFNAISSCMAIRKRVFDDYKYNEKLFVDEVDHCFCRDQRSRGRIFKILNIEVSQNFHQRGHSLTSDAGWRRLRLRIYDIFRHARILGGGKYIVLALVKCCGLSIQIAVKSKSVTVIAKALGLSCRLMCVDK